MMKQEFCELTGVKYENLTQADWDVITTVYNYHPLITDVGGKKQLAGFYKAGGMGTMYDMYATAEQLEINSDIMQMAEVAKEKLIIAYNAKLEEIATAHNAEMKLQEDAARTAQERVTKILKRFNR